MTAWALVILFAVHLVGFAGLWVKRRQPRYIRLVVLFGCLVAHYALRATEVDVTLGPTTLAALLRIVALILALWSIADFVLRRLRGTSGSTGG